MSKPASGMWPVLFKGASAPPSGNTKKRLEQLNLRATDVGRKKESIKSTLCRIQCLVRIMKSYFAQVQIISGRYKNNHAKKEVITFKSISFMGT